jgi:hypothetical protein
VENMQQRVVHGPVAAQLERVIPLAHSYGFKAYVAENDGCRGDGARSLRLPRRKTPSDLQSA